MTPTLILSAAAGAIAGIAAWREGRDLAAALIVAGLTGAAVFAAASAAEWLISLMEAGHG